MLKITIEDIQLNDVQPLGYMRLPSYAVLFQSSLVSGWARFVPARDNPLGYVGETLQVEVNQESTSQFVHSSTASEALVTPLATLGDYRIRGTIASIDSISDPPDGFTVVISVGETAFCLSHLDIDRRNLSVGATIEFTAHEVSLWDEEI